MASVVSLHTIPTVENTGQLSWNQKFNKGYIVLLLVVIALSFIQFFSGALLIDEIPEIHYDVLLLLLIKKGLSPILACTVDGLD